MRVLFIGLGSIAGRHIKNLKDILSSHVEISVLRSGRGREIPSSLADKINRVCISDDELDRFYDAVFITNPTSLHYETLLKYLHFSNVFFIEKPVFVTGEEDLNAFINENKKYYVACPLRYTNAIQWLKGNIDFTKVHSMRAISSSYLPDWRLGTDYRKTYSAHKYMGGGVSMDLIHEWDYVSYLVGFPLSMQSLIKKKSNLEIDSDDVAVYIADYGDKVVEVHLDYFGRKPVRQLELFTEDDTIVTDLIDQKIEWLSSGRIVSFPEDRDSYQKKELQHFMDIMSGKICSDNGIEEACKVLRIARGGL